MSVSIPNPIVGTWIALSNYSANKINNQYSISQYPIFISSFRWLKSKWKIYEFKAFNIFKDQLNSSCILCHRVGSIDGLDLVRGIWWTFVMYLVHFCAKIENFWFYLRQTKKITQQRNLDSKILLTQQNRIRFYR